MYPPPGILSNTIPPIIEHALPTATTAIKSIAQSTTTMITSSLASSSITTTPTLTSIISATITAISISTASPNPPGSSFGQSSTSSSPPSTTYDHPPVNGECKLLGSFALLVQAALGGCAVLALVYKRWRERPQRPLKIWFFDVSKQVVGSALVHVVNLFMSMLSSGQFGIKVEGRSLERMMVGARGHYQPNPCSFYLLNLAIDTTIGIPILILILRVLTILFTFTPLGQPPCSIASGNYGSPPSTKWWAKQSFIYFIGLLLMKLCVLLIFLVLPWISQVGDWALKWTEGNETLQVVFVMLFFPLVMNATQYYIIDGFIKKREGSGAGDVVSGGEDADERGTETYDVSTSDDGVDSDIEEDGNEGKKPLIKRTPSLTQRRKKVASKKKIIPNDYDPELDGENSPTVVGSGSGSERGPSTPRLMRGEEESGK